MDIRFADIIDFVSYSGNTPTNKEASFAIITILQIKRKNECIERMTGDFGVDEYIWWTI